MATPLIANASTPTALDARDRTPRLGALDDLVDYGTRRAKEALRRIGAKSGALPFRADGAKGYCIDWLTRKATPVATFFVQQHFFVCVSPVSCGHPTTSL